MTTHYEHCLAHCIRKTDRVISQIYNEHLAPLGIKITQFSVLRALYYLKTTTAKAVQEVLVMEQATISRALQPLIRDGYITVLEGQDKREKLISLSASGQALYQSALEPWSVAQQRLKEELGSELETTLLHLCQQVTAMKIA